MYGLCYFSGQVQTLKNIIMNIIMCYLEFCKHNNIPSLLTGAVGTVDLKKLELDWEKSSGTVKNHKLQSHFKT